MGKMCLGVGGGANIKKKITRNGNSLAMPRAATVWAQQSGLLCMKFTYMVVMMCKEKKINKNLGVEIFGIYKTVTQLQFMSRDKIY